MWLFCFNNRQYNSGKTYSTSIDSKGKFIVCCTRCEWCVIVCNTFQLFVGYLNTQFRCFIPQLRVYMSVHFSLNIKLIALVVTIIFLCAQCYNMPSAKTRRLRDKQRYASGKESISAAHKEYYHKNSEKCKELAVGIVVIIVAAMRKWSAWPHNDDWLLTTPFVSSHLPCLMRVGSY